MKKKIVITCIVVLMAALGVWIYNTWFGTTKVAFVNFQTINMGAIAKANDNPKVKVADVPTDRLAELGHSENIFTMGMRGKHDGRMIGVNLYGWTAETGECVKLPLLYYADFYILKDTVIKNGFYSGEDSWINSNDTTNYSLWEIANCRYPGEQKFEDVLEANDRGSMPLHLFGPVTLTHGR